MESIKKLLSSIGYALKAPGMGISEPFGTAWAAERSPNNVYPTTIRNPVGPSAKQSILSNQPLTTSKATTNSGPLTTNKAITTNIATNQNPVVASNNATSGPDYGQQLQDSRDQALSSLKQRLGVINTDLETGKTEAAKLRDQMAGNIGNAFGIRQMGDWSNPTYNDISVGTGDLNSQFDLAKQKWYDPSSPSSLLSQLFNTLSTGRSNLNTERTNVTNLYGDENTGTGLLGAAKNSQQTQDRALNQNDLDTILKYSQAGGNARRAMESAINKNRMFARARGTLGSSFYDQLQGDTANTAAKTISNIGTEEAGKRTEIAGKRTDLQNWLTSQLANYKAEKAMKGEAINQKEIDMFNDMIKRSGDVKTGAIGEYQKTGQSYADAIREANKLKSLNDINYGDMEAGIEQNYQTGLNNIQNYLQNKVLQERAILANAGSYNTGYDTTTPTSTGVSMKGLGTNTGVEDLLKKASPEVQNLITKNQTVNPAVEATAALPDTFKNMLNNFTGPTEQNSATLTDILSMLSPAAKKKSTLDRYLYG